MKMISFTLLCIVQLAVAVVLLSFLVFLWAFNDAPGPAPLWMKLATAFVLAYPFIAATGLILQKKVSVHFMWLHLILLVAGIGCIIAVLMIVGSGVKDANKLSAKYREENIIEYEKASRDFTCEDGSFFEVVKVTPENTAEPGKWSCKIFYYPKESREYGNDLVAWVSKDGNARVKIVERLGETQAAVMEKMGKCRNKEGKSIFDIYPEAGKENR